MSKPTNRVTLFKIPNAEDQQKLLDIYKGMPSKAVKVKQTCSTPPAIEE